MSVSDSAAVGRPVAGLARGACRALAGLDRGMAAAALALGWFALHGWLRGEFWWAKFNVAGALFYGPAVYGMGIGRATAAGLALLFVIYTLFGAGFAWIARPRGLGRNLLLGLVWALAWHLVAQRWLWRMFDPFGPAYFPLLASLPAHVLAGLALARYAARFRSLALSYGGGDWMVAEWPPEPLETPLAEPPETSAGPPEEKSEHSKAEADC
jgi:hypothetical protein